MFYAISGDGMGIPRQFNTVTIGGGASVGSPFLLGDGSVGFVGGLAFRPDDGLFYSLFDDGTGSSTFASFALNGGGAVQTVAPAGTGFNGGLTYDTENGSFYAISNDMTGFSTINKITPTGTVNALFGLGFGFVGGLTFDSSDGNFYSVAQFQGTWNLEQISLGGAVMPVMTLGDGSLGFNGGLVFNPGDGFFYAISNDSMGNSTLNRISVALDSITPIAPALGQGFYFGALTLVDEPGAAPEPSAGFLAVTGFAALCLRKIRFKKNRKDIKNE